MTSSVKNLKKKYIAMMKRTTVITKSKNILVAANGDIINWCWAHRLIPNLTNIWWSFKNWLEHNENIILSSKTNYSKRLNTCLRYKQHTASFRCVTLTIITMTKSIRRSIHKVSLLFDNDVNSREKWEDLLACCFC